MEKDYVNIRLRSQTHDKLKSLAKYGDTMDEVVSKIIKKLEEGQFLKKSGEDNNV